MALLIQIHISRMPPHKFSHLYYIESNHIYILGKMNAAMHKLVHGLATPRDVCKEVRDHRKSIQSRRSISWCSSDVTLLSSCLCNFIWCAMLKCHICMCVYSWRAKEKKTRHNKTTKPSPALTRCHRATPCHICTCGRAPTAPPTTLSK